MIPTLQQPIDQVREQLEQFSPADKFHLHSTSPAIVYSPGIKYLAEQTDGFWLLDAIAEQLASDNTKRAMQHDERLRTLQEWSLEVIHDVGTPEYLEGRAGFLCRPFFEQYRPPHRDLEPFPLDFVRLLAVRDGVRWLLVLPSEKPNFVSHRNSEEIGERWKKLFQSINN